MDRYPTIPSQYQTIMPYLIVPNASAFIDFMKVVYAATETYRMMRDETLLAHAEVMVGGSTLMLADSTVDFAPRGAGMFIYVPDADETYRVALAHGATSIMPPSDQPYGRSCGIRDPFGNDWWPTSYPHLSAA